MKKLCNKNKCRRACLWCVVAWAGLPIEHGLWQWTGLERFLPLVGLHL